MKTLLTLSFLLIIHFQLFSQDDGGMLCGGEDEIPVWIVRLKIIDRETHHPIQNANIEIYNNSGDGMKWKADYNGVAVLVMTSPNCLPYEGIIEITSNNYRYDTHALERNYFKSEENNRRIYLEGHRHNWTDINQIPSTQELINKIRDRRYQVGVKNISTGYGFDMVNYAPACFEFEIELERTDNNYYPHKGKPGKNLPDDYSNQDSQIPSFRFNGENIYVFPNDLSGGSFHAEQAKGACNALNRLGYDDWYLPSKYELNLLYINREKIGGFTYGWYWSSTSTSDGRRYWGQSFDDGLQETEYKGTTYNIHKGNIKVRCIRKD